MSLSNKPSHSFYDEVYRVVRLIPPGRVTTYGTIAMLLGKPMAARAVGYALAALTPGSDVPWQRVINREGRISPRGVGEREPFLQRTLLEREGIRFDAEDRIDLRAFGWEGPPELQP